MSNLIDGISAFTIGIALISVSTPKCSPRFPGYSNRKSVDRTFSFFNTRSIISLSGTFINTVHFDSENSGPTNQLILPNMCHCENMVRQSTTNFLHKLQ